MCWEPTGWFAWHAAALKIARYDNIGRLCNLPASAVLATNPPVGTVVSLTLHYQSPPDDVTYVSGRQKTDADRTKGQYRCIVQDVFHPSCMI
jgi:hypothetical protein